MPPLLHMLAKAIRFAWLWLQLLSNAMVNILESCFGFRNPAVRSPLIAMPSSSKRGSDSGGKFHWSIITSWIDAGKLTIARWQGHIRYLRVSDPGLHIAMGNMHGSLNLISIHASIVELYMRLRSMHPRMPWEPDVSVCWSVLRETEVYVLHSAFSCSSGAA